MSLTLTTGTTIVGQTFISTGFDDPCIIINTTQPVRLIACRFVGPGDAVRKKPGYYAGIDVEMIGCLGLCANPNQFEQISGRFFDSETNGGINRLVIRNCVFFAYSGIRVRDADGAYIRIENNIAYWTNGRKSDGAGGWLTDFDRTPADNRQFVALRNQSNLDCKVRQNAVINMTLPEYPMTLPELRTVLANNYLETTANGVTWLPRTEDVINLNSGGTQATPLTVEENLIIGSYWEKTAISGNNFSGTGIISDGGSNAWIDIIRNGVFNVGNAGISLNDAAGNAGSVKALYNTIFSSAILPGFSDVDATILEIWNAGGINLYSSTGGSVQFQSNPSFEFKFNRIGWNNSRLKSGQKELTWRPWNLGSLPHSEIQGTGDPNPGEPYNVDATAGAILTKTQERAELLNYIDTVLVGKQIGLTGWQLDISSDSGTTWTTYPSSVSPYELNGLGAGSYLGRLRRLCQADGTASAWSSLQPFTI